MPGFTAISMYPELWEARGISKKGAGEHADPSRAWTVTAGRDLLRKERERKRRK